MHLQLKEYSVFFLFLATKKLSLSKLTKENKKRREKKQGE